MTDATTTTFKLAPMAWTAAANTLVGIHAYHLPNDGTGDNKVRLQIGASHIDLNERQRRELAEHLLQGLEAEVS